MIQDIVRELHEAFGRPSYFHLGCDEAEPPSCALCCADGYGRRVAEHIESMVAFVRSLGARPMIWHDKFLLHGDPRWKGLEANGSPETAAMLETLIRDVIICDWHYAAPCEGDRHFASLDHFRALGFDAMTCPWDNLDGIAAQCAYARQHGIGIVCTTWNRLATYDAPRFLSYAAACAWGEAAQDSIKATDEVYCSVRFAFSTHWRQVGWDTPGTNRYPECGFLSDQASTSIGER